ncbi:MAG: ABC transporter ATP-binding protein [Desulfuromusa sp.]|nr:ABC transporter ATP-binding protein [Desulfuromusa sp.]
MAELQAEKLIFGRRNFSLQIDSLRIVAGEKVAVMGENGCGKSTLLQLLCGLLSPAAGVVRYNGNNLDELLMARRAKLFSLLPQLSEVIFPFSVYEVVLFGRFPHCSGNSFSSQDDEKTRLLLARLDLLDFSQRPFNQLSGGEQRRVMLARVLNQQAEIIYLDEPNASLDIRHTLDIFALLSTRPETVIAPVHDINLAYRFFERFLFLKQGRLLADVARKDVTPELLKETYGVQVTTGTAVFQFHH